MTRRRHDLVVTRWGAKYLGRTFFCSVGWGGISTEKREGDGITPAGVWRLTSGAWRGDRIARPRTVLPLTKIGPNDLWSDDPDHDGYNKRHFGLHPDFRHERLRRSDHLYNFVLFSDWNTAPAVTGKGSAIFVHCWKRPRRPTAGCIAFVPKDLLWIAERWTMRSRIIVQP